MTSLEFGCQTQAPVWGSNALCVLGEWDEIVWNIHSMTTQTEVSSSEQPDSALRRTETWIKYVNSYCANDLNPLPLEGSH